MTKVDFDVGIIGGGPGGAAMGAYLARAGLRCVVLEKEPFPRPHVGESLVPSSTRVFRDIGFLDTMEASGFPHKYGAVWTASGSRRVYEHDWEGLSESVADIRFDEREQAGVGQSYTYHVDRSKFDLLLLEHAEASGARVVQGARIAHVDLAGKLPVLHSVSRVGREDIRVRLVVDASGRATVLGRKLGLRVRDPVFDQFALHAWFEGYDRRVVVKHPGQEDYIYVHFLPFRDSWVWQIPISDDVTSIGVVTQRKHFAGTKASREKFFWECIASRPELLENLRKARRIRPLQEEGDYSYSMRQICGNGFILIGDAARFVDPIFSTGVSIALNGARFASRDIVAAAEKCEFSHASFRRFESIQRRGTRNWYEFISLYYRLNVLFTAFLMDPRYRLSMLRLLQGDVYEEDEPEVLVNMRRVVREVEEDPRHPWHGSLGGLTATSVRPQY